MPDLVYKTYINLSLGLHELLLGKVYPVIPQENPKLAEYEHKIGTQHIFFGTMLMYNSHRSQFLYI